MAPATAIRRPLAALMSVSFVLGAPTILFCAMLDPAPLRRLNPPTFFHPRRLVVPLAVPDPATVVVAIAVSDFERRNKLLAAELRQKVPDQQVDWSKASRKLRKWDKPVADDSSTRKCGSVGVCVVLCGCGSFYGPAADPPRHRFHGILQYLTDTCNRGDCRGDTWPCENINLLKLGPPESWWLFFKLLNPRAPIHWSRKERAGIMSLYNGNLCGLCCIVLYNTI